MRSLAARLMELASSPLMQERRRLWTALKDRKAERLMFLFETWTWEGYILESELVCQDSDLWYIERHPPPQHTPGGKRSVTILSWIPSFASWHAAPPWMASAGHLRPRPG